MRLPASRSTVRALFAPLFVTSVLGCSGGGGSVGQPSTGTSSGEGGASGTVSRPEPGAPGGAHATDAASAGEQPSSQAGIARNIFDPSVTDFVVHAFHEEGAEPYVGRLGLTSDDTWDITAESYGDLFAAHAGRTLSIPSTLEQMREFPDRGLQSWSFADLAELGESLAPPLVAGNAIHVSILFVNGLYDGNDAILGLHLSNTRYAFVFKDVVESVGGDSLTRRYVEQATVVHELGHTVGFVDNGVPMVNEHEDAEHAHHTTNGDGVMYWAVESKNGILSFLTDVVAGARLSLFGPEVLLDAHNYMPDN